MMGHMARIHGCGIGLAMAAVLSGCVGDLASRNSDRAGVIASPLDTGGDQSALVFGEAALIIDPDGCEAWLIDDGHEGYSARRYDPITGLPRCDSPFPPGTVIGEYETSDTEIPDFVPRR